MKCVIKDGKLILPEGFCLPEKEMIMCPNLMGEIRLYTQKSWDDLCECVKSIEDEHIQKAMLRMLFCSAVIIDGEKKEIELNENMSDMLMDGEAELTAEDDCIVVKNLSNI